jgi:transposase
MLGCHDSEGIMAGMVVHLSTDELEARFRASSSVVERTHFQVIWLLAKGRTIGETAEVTAISERWVSKLAERYARHGAEALGDLRRGNRGARPLLSDDALEALRERLRRPPDDGVNGADRRLRAGSRGVSGLSMSMLRGAGKP